MQKSGQILRGLLTKPSGSGFSNFKVAFRCMSVSVVEPKDKASNQGQNDIPEVSVGSDKVKATFMTPKLRVPVASGVKVDAVPPIVELTREIRHRAWNAGFLDMNDVRENAMTFIAGLRYEFTPAPPSPDAENAITLTGVGDTSFSTRLTMALPSSGLEVANTMYWVHVDRGTRAAIPLPDWFKTKYLFAANRASADKVAPLRLPRYQKPTWIRRTITRDEIDKFGHTNYEHYLSYAIASMRENLAHPGNQPLEGGALPDVLGQSVRGIDVLFSGETRLGADLQICSWLVKDTPDTAFAMVYNNGRPIVHATFRFNKPPKSNI